MQVASVGRALLPTPVGMILYDYLVRAITTATPHTRGDDPRRAVGHEAIETYSPHPWG